MNLRVQRRGPYYYVYDATNFQEENPPVEIPTDFTICGQPAHFTEQDKQAVLETYRQMGRKLKGRSYGYKTVAAFEIKADMKADTIVYEFEKNQMFTESQVREIIRKARRAASRLRSKAKAKVKQ